jgi:hypothetical protein
MEPLTVILYGQSMLLSLVASSLEQTPHLQVICASDNEKIEAYATGTGANVLIFDLTEPCQRQVLPLLIRNPHLLLIGLDAERNHALLLSGRETNSFTMNQILELVEGGKPEHIQPEVDKYVG